ncbi:MAG TPA: hypothetical protein VMS64_20955 [Candidatus Methylomirabilis sp.]|nr:hypothetical protein [Candidatus Methylomirabilis sp.]
MSSSDVSAGAQALPVVRDTPDHLAGTINMVLKRYRQVAAYHGDDK